MSSTDLKKHVDTEITESLSLIEITEVLIKHHGYHEGVFNLAVEFQIGVGNFGPDPSMPAPGAVLGVTRIGLGPAPTPPNNASVDASIVNPSPSSVKKRVTKKKSAKK